MKTFKICYSAPNKGMKSVHGHFPCFIYKEATYHCETEEEAIAKFNRYHANKRHTISHIWEETEIDRLRKYLTRQLMPR